MQVTKHRAWTGVLVPAVTPLWVSPCPHHPRPFPRAHPAPISAPLLPPPPPGNESQMWPRCGRGGSSVLPCLEPPAALGVPWDVSLPSVGAAAAAPLCSPRLRGGQWAPDRPEGTELARFTGGCCGCEGGARCHHAPSPGVNMMLRKIAVAAAAKPAVEIRQDGESLYIRTSTPVRTTEIHFRVGEEFEEQTVDGRPCKVGT